MSLRLGAYRWFQSWVVEKAVLPRLMSPLRIEEARSHSLLSEPIPAVKPGIRRAWFHAASVGELESLTPLILEWVAEGEECVVTVLSESARGTLQKLAQLLKDLPGTLLFSGYSPWEGSWRAAFKRVSPTVFLTAKYEAWPELWSAVAEIDIPLLIVSAKARRSLKLAGFLCKALGGKIPRLTLMTVRPEDTRELRKIFGDPQIKMIETGEPRWDRVQARAKQGSPRARALIAHYRNLPRPWGVLGSVWPEDMEVWRGRYAKGAATLWVVPHRVDIESVEEIERYLVRGGMTVARSSQFNGALHVNCVLVDEMGFLLELYASADWAYVGGGFGVSMHSTIEPALFGIPVSCGAHGADKFPEIGELVETGQLTLVDTAEALDRWMNQLNPLFDGGLQRKQWTEQSQGRLGATKRIFQIMRA